jgi:phage host-nuclease inhibitor protein Gam
MDINTLIKTAEENPPAPALAELTIPPELADYEDDAHPEVRAAWEIETIQGADFALLRKAECEQEVAEAEAMRRAAIAEINRRADVLKAKAQRGVDFFEFKLLQWMEKHRASIVHGKKKSRTLINGTVGWRAHPLRLVVADERALEGWLRTRPIDSGLARWKVEPEMKAIQALFSATGEIPPGCETKDAEDAPYTKAEPPTTALAKGA